MKRLKRINNSDRKKINSGKARIVLNFLFEKIGSSSKRIIVTVEEF